MATISIQANTVRPSVDRRPDDTAFRAGTFSWQDPVHSWKAGPGLNGIMTVGNLFIIRIHSVFQMNKTKHQKLFQRKVLGLMLLVLVCVYGVVKEAKSTLLLTVITCSHPHLLQLVLVTNDRECEKLSLIGFHGISSIDRGVGTKEAMGQMSPFPNLGQSKEL